jgi:uncharacterized membrane protein YoaK (UPF0700 family)
MTGLTITSFFVGGITGSVIRRHLRRPPLELIVMALLLLAATPIRTEVNNAVPVELGLLAMAMAMQGETISRIGTVSIQTVVVTTNLLHFADVLVGRFLSAPASAEGQGTHSRPTVTEVAIPGCAWASYSIGACAGALAIVTVRAPLLFPILVIILLVADMLLNAESKPVVRMAGANPVAGRSGGQ